MAAGSTKFSTSSGAFDVGQGCYDYGKYSWVAPSPTCTKTRGPPGRGSTVYASNSSGAMVTNRGYWGYGKYRLGGTLPTDHRYTAPRGPPKLDTATGLMYYGARSYDHVVGREPSGWRHRQVGAFISPRPAGPRLVPDPANLWDYNRFGYARLNPMKFTDPGGYYRNDEIIQIGPVSRPMVLAGPISIMKAFDYCFGDTNRRPWREFWISIW